MKSFLTPEEINQQIEDVKYYFRKYQKVLVAFANTPFGRDFLKLPKNINNIWKLTPNSYHEILGIQDKKLYVKGNFYCKYHIFCPQQLYIALLAMDIAKENSASSLLHYLGFLPDLKRYPQFMFNTTSFYTGAGDGSCVHSPGGSTTWANTINALASSAADYTSTTNTMGQAETASGSGAPYNCGRGFLPADTSALTALSTLVSGSLNITAATVRSGENDTIYLEQTTQAATTQVVTDDFDQVGSATNGGSKAMNTMSGGGSYAIDLTATSLGWISKTGVTKIGTKLGFDINATIPNPSAGADLLIINTSENASGKPYYSLTYTLPGGMMGAVEI